MLPLNADEVYQIAERVETNAAEFYTKAANLHADRSDVNFLRDLAKMEYGHRNTVSEMRKTLPPEAHRLPDNHPYLKATLYLTRIADALGGEGRLSMADPLTASDTLEALVRKGIRLEKEAILFYLGLKDMVPENRGKKKIDQIITEEQSHLVILTLELAKLTGVP